MHILEEDIEYAIESLKKSVEVGPIEPEHDIFLVEGEAMKIVWNLLCELKFDLEASKIMQNMDGSGTVN